MIIAQRYTIERVASADSFKIHNHDAPLCPVCSALCSGYDSRPRHTIDGAGVVRWFALRRLRCPGCKRLHIELPAFMQSKKHYEAQVIAGVLSDRSGDCPADNSTMWRWRHENHPPGLQCYSDIGMVK